MDKYTKATKTWLDKRFRKYDENGVYYAHQPIYGFRYGHSEPGFLQRYIRTYQIMISLSHLRFSSLLDVGGAEGYQTNLVKHFFSVKVQHCDLSEQACRRSKKIFEIESVSADICNLPFKTSSYDVVLCSEVLEHVPNYNKAIYELLRVARNAVVVTVPHESKESIKKGVEKQKPHSHLHNFTTESLNFLRSDAHLVINRQIINPLLRIPGIIVEAIPRKHHEWCQERTRYPFWIINIYNAILPIQRRIINERVTAFFVKLDELMFKLFRSSNYFGVIFIILKNQGCFSSKTFRYISAYKVINFKVPYHYIQKKK